MNRVLSLLCATTLLIGGATVAASQPRAQSWTITAASATVEGDTVVLRTSIDGSLSFGELSWREDTPDGPLSIYVDQYMSTYVSHDGETIDCPNLATTVDRESGTEEWTTTVPAGCIAAGTYQMLINRSNIEGGDTSNTYGPVELTSPGGDIPEPEFEPATIQRLAGASRYETAVAISQHRYPNGSSSVILVNANVQVDALPGSQLAGAMLYVPADGPVPQVVLDEVGRLNPSTITVLGGTGAVSDDVAAQAQAQTAHRVN